MENPPQELQENFSLIPRKVVAQTRLSRRPNENAFLLTGFLTFFMALIGFLYWNNYFHLQEWMTASPIQIFQKNEWYRAWTTLVAHADEKHLLSNSMLFFVLGSFLSSYFGYFTFPVMAFFFGGITNLIVLKGMPLESSLIGASGVVFWLGGVWLTLYSFLDVKRSHYQRFLRSMGVALVLFFPAEAFDPNISYQAHLVGFLLGILYAVIYYFINRKEFLKEIRYKLVYDEVDITPSKYQTATHLDPHNP